MLDKYFCKRLHAKKITLDMIMDYIQGTPIYGECLCVFFVFAAALSIIQIANLGFIAAILPPVCLGAGGAVIALLFRYFIAPKITVASCPLTKTGGNNNV